MLNACYTTISHVPSGPPADPDTGERTKPADQERRIVPLEIRIVGYDVDDLAVLSASRLVPCAAAPDARDARSSSTFMRWAKIASPEV